MKLSLNFNWNCIGSCVYLAVIAIRNLRKHPHSIITKEKLIVGDKYSLIACFLLPEPEVDADLKKEKLMYCD
jgi:hypothetical protein